MATRAYEILAQEANYMVVRWAGLAQSDDGQAFIGALGYDDRTVQIAGTFGTATLAIQGTSFLPPFNGAQAPSNWLALTDPQGNSLSGMNAARIESVMESPPAMRPLITGGDGTTSLTVILTASRSAR